MSLVVYDAAYCLEQLARYVCEQRFLDTVAHIKSGRVSASESGLPRGYDAIVGMLEATRLEVKKAIVATNYRLKQERIARETAVAVEQATNLCVDVDDCVDGDLAGDHEPVDGSGERHGRGKGGQRVMQQSSEHNEHGSSRHHVNDRQRSRAMERGASMPHVDAVDRPLGGVRWRGDCCGSFGTPVCQNYCCQGKQLTDEYLQLSPSELHEIRVLQYPELVNQAQRRHNDDKEFGQIDQACRVDVINQLGECPKYASGTVLEFPPVDATRDESLRWYDKYDKSLSPYATVMNRGHFDPVPSDGSQQRLQFRREYEQFSGGLVVSLEFLREYTVPVWLHSTIVGVSVRVGDKYFAMPNGVASIPNAHPLGLGSAYVDMYADGEFTIRRYFTGLVKPGFVPKFRRAKVGELVTVPCVTGRQLSCGAAVNVSSAGDIAKYGCTPHINSVGSPVVAVTDGAVVGLHQRTVLAPHSSKFYNNLDKAMNKAFGHHVGGGDYSKWEHWE